MYNSYYLVVQVQVQYQIQLVSSPRMKKNCFRPTLFSPNFNQLPLMYIRVLKYPLHWLAPRATSVIGVGQELRGFPQLWISLTQDARFRSLQDGGFPWPIHTFAKSLYTATRLCCAFLHCKFLFPERKMQALIINHDSACAVPCIRYFVQPHRCSNCSK